MSRAPNVKFLAFVDPHENECLKLDIQHSSDGEDRITCSARVYAGEVVFCSFRGDFVIQG